MITMCQQLSFGYRINFRLCSIFSKTIHGLSWPTVSPHTLGSGRISRVPAFPHTCSVLPPSLPPSLCFPPALPPIPLQKWTDRKNCPHSPCPQFPLIWIIYMLLLCALVNLYPSLALGVYHTLVCLFMHFHLGCECEAEQLTMHLCVLCVWDSPTFRRLAINVEYAMNICLLISLLASPYEESVVCLC